MRHDVRQRGGLDRRAFLKGLAALGGAVAVSGCAGGSLASASGAPGRLGVPGRDRMGIQLYTVRDLTGTDLEGTLAQLAQIGFKEVEPTGYGNYTPQQYRAILDRVGLTAPSTHANLIPGPNLEAQLEGYRIMGHRYARSANSAPAPAGSAPAQGGGGQQPQTVDLWKRRSELFNQVGEAASRYGIKVIYHNHSAEFAPLAGSTLNAMEVMLAETDPRYVVFELDIGWSSVAGFDAVTMFRRYPGRFPLWHVKDVTGLRNMTPQQTVAERQRLAGMAKVGEGEIDWRPIFANAELAGLEHFFMEIEGEAVADGSLNAARVSFQNLSRILG